MQKVIKFNILEKHICSKSISDKDGNALQHLSYLPFGEVFANQKAQNSNFDTEYKFLGKELDAETGYIATDFRYYDPGLGVFLSVDPMAEERSWITPYAYCQNNPIGRIDPSGALDDEYDLDKKTGQITWRNDNKHYDTNGNEVDKLFNSKGESIDVTAGVLGQKQEKNNANGYSSYAFPSGAEAETFYYFSAESSDVEWAIVKLKFGNAHVGTDHKHGSTSMLGRYEKSSGNLIDFGSHSHPAPGSPPSCDIWGPNGEKVGDINSAGKSKLNYQREVYNVPNRTIYGYDKYNTKENPFNYSKRRD